MKGFGSFLLLRSQDPFPFKQPIRIRYCQNLYEDEIIRLENIAPERKIELVKLIWSEVKNWTYLQTDDLRTRTTVCKVRETRGPLDVLFETRELIFEQREKIDSE